MNHIEKMLANGQLFEAIKELGDIIPKGLQLKAESLKSQSDQKGPNNKYKPGEFEDWFSQVSELQQDVLTIFKISLKY